MPISARPVISSWCSRSSIEMTNAEATMPSMANAIAMKACSMAAVPPRRVTISRASPLSPTSSPTPCTTLPIISPYRHRPVVHSSSAPRLTRHASASGGQCGTRRAGAGARPAIPARRRGDPAASRRTPSGPRTRARAVPIPTTGRRRTVEPVTTSPAARARTARWIRWPTGRRRQRAA